MKKISKEQTWKMAKEVAEKMYKANYTKQDVREIDQHEMATKFNEIIRDMPTVCDEGIEEDQTFGYFKALVFFYFVGFKDSLIVSHD